MYTMINDVERLICIPPSELGEDLDSIVDNLTWETYGGRLGEDKSFTVLIQNVRKVGPGRIVHGNGGVHQAVKFDQLVFKPVNDEVIEGNVVEIVKFGAFVRFGPLDGLLHVSQVMDDRVDIDEANQRLVGKESGRYLAVGDVVRARIVSVDLNEKSPQDSKIGLTMRQIGLGKLQWLDEDNKKKSSKEDD